MHDLENEIQSEKPADPSGKVSLRRHLTFWSICCLIAVVWCVVLPAWERVSPTTTADYDKLGIDPAAFFYTDLEVVDDALDRLDRFKKQHPQALWNPYALDDKAAATQSTTALDNGTE